MHALYTTRARYEKIAPVRESTPMSKDVKPSETTRKLFHAGLPRNSTSDAASSLQTWLCMIVCILTVCEYECAWAIDCLQLDHGPECA